MLGPILLTLHNLHHYQAVMAGLRQAITDGKLADFADAFHHRLSEGDLPVV